MLLFALLPVIAVSTGMDYPCITGVQCGVSSHGTARTALVTTLRDIQGLIDKHDTHLFRSITYTDQCLHYLLPEKLNRSMNLRHRGHDYTLSHIRTTQLKNINRCLFSMI